MTCPYCPANACRGCVQRYLLSSHEDPHCLGCRKAWNREFIDLHLTKTFRSGPLRKHRAKTLMDREKAMLPAMQIFVEAVKEQRTVAALMATVMDVIRQLEAKRVEILRTRDTIRNKIRAARTDEEEKAGLALLDENCNRYGQLESKMMRTRFDHEVLQRRLNRAINILEGRAADDNKTAEPVREFIQHCPADGCRGYLSTAYKCGVCAKYTCNECLCVKGDNRDAEHTCKEEAKASAALIRRETKPCPKCGVRIYKIDGCDQMFCTQETCHTAFSWNTGHVITGNIHNPHYYEYLRHRNGGAIPREAGDIPCGGLPAAWQFSRDVLSTTLPVETKNLMMHIHRTLSDMADVRLPEFPAQRPANVNKDINIRYLMNEMEEDAWKKMLEQRETKFERKREIGQILTTFTHVGSEIIRNITTGPGLTTDARAKMIKAGWEKEATHLNDLRVYTNNSLKALGERMICAFPQIDKDWNYIPPRKMGVDESQPSASEIAAERMKARVAPPAPTGAGAPVNPPAPAVPLTAAQQRAQQIAEMQLRNTQRMIRHAAAQRAAAPPVARGFAAGDYAEDDAVVVE